MKNPLCRHKAYIIRRQIQMVDLEGIVIQNCSRIPLIRHVRDFDDGELPEIPDYRIVTDVNLVRESTSCVYYNYYIRLKLLCRGSM